METGLEFVRLDDGFCVLSLTKRNGNKRMESRGYKEIGVLSLTKRNGNLSVS